MSVPNTYTSLTTFAKNCMTPTEDQEKAFEQLDVFIDSPIRTFLLKGYAGTGKTTITKTIAAFAKQTGKNVLLMAPTGRAARILSMKTGMAATTIHKGIYNIRDLQELKVHKDGKVKYKFRYNLLSILENTQAWIIVDEASMVSDTYNEDDFFIFGSGFLLRDLMEYAAPGNERRNGKIIFIGDDAQLPPVGSPISGALSAKYLQETYDIPTMEYQLTQVVRQNEDSGILALAGKIRGRQQSSGRKYLEVDTQNKDVHATSNTIMPELFQQLNPNLNFEQCIVLVSKNKLALEHNLRIRKLLLPGEETLVTGETLMITQNNYNYELELFNGTLVKVLKSWPTAETKANMLSYDAAGNECRVSHRFRRVLIEVADNMGTAFEVSCLILDSFLYSPDRSLSYEENISLYLDFKLRHPTLNPGTDAFRTALQKDPYFNAIRVKYGYAITVHKAQGGEWGNVICNLEYYNSPTSQDFFRWFYTAVTRAANQLWLYNIPHADRFGRMTFVLNGLMNVKESTAAGMSEKVLLHLPVDIDERLHKLGLAPSGFQYERYLSLLAQLNATNIAIAEREPIQFGEKYIFEQDGNKAFLTLYYNGKQKYTTISPTGGKDKHQNAALLALTMDLLKQPVDFEVALVNQTESDTLVDPEMKHDLADNKWFDKHEPHLFELYINLFPLLEPLSIQIESIEHMQFGEKYQFERSGETAVMQFYYDGRQQFTRAIFQAQQCNSQQLYIDLKTTIEFLASSNN